MSEENEEKRSKENEIKKVNLRRICELLKKDIESIKKLRSQDTEKSMRLPACWISLVDEVEPELHKLTESQHAKDNESEKDKIAQALMNILLSYQNFIDVERTSSFVRGGKKLVYIMDDTKQELFTLMRKNYRVHFYKYQIISGLVRYQGWVPEGVDDHLNRLIKGIKKISVSETNYEEANKRINDRLALTYITMKRIGRISNLGEYLLLLLDTDHCSILREYQGVAKQFMELVIDILENTDWKKLRDPTGVKEMQKIVNRSKPFFDYLTSMLEINECGKTALARWSPTRELIMKEFYSAIEKSDIELLVEIRTQLPRIAVPEGGVELKELKGYRF